MSAKTDISGYALLIGVDDYSTYDASVKAGPSDTASLLGSVNDVRAWFRLCSELGYPAENIRVLASPEIARPELEGATVAPATDTAIREGVAWLADKLGAPDKPPGVLTFSGHGDLSPKGLLLCPTNVKANGDDLENTVNLAALQALIAARNAGRNLTAVIDCCHSGDAEGDGKHRRVSALRKRALERGQSIIAPALGEHMFFASNLGDPAYQAEFGGGLWRGAFTWAFMNVKSQWSIVEGPTGSRELSISYEEMRERIASLLEALSFDQTPALRCRPSQGDLPVFHRGPAADENDTSSDPDATRTRVQLDPGQLDYRVYTVKYFTGATWTQFGKVLVPHDTKTFGSTTYSAGTEYWYLTANVPSTATNLSFSWSDSNWGTSAPSLGTLSFTMIQNASWISTTAPGKSSTLYVKNGQLAVSLNWKLTFSNNLWGGSLSWYTTSGQNTVFGGTTSTSAQLVNNTAPTTSWYKAAVSPQ